MAQLDFKNPAVQKAFLYVVAGGSLLSVFFFTHFVPFGYPNQHEKTEALKSEYEKKATELSRARATVADLPRFEAEYARQHDRWASAAEKLPTERQLPGEKEVKGLAEVQVKNENGLREAAAKWAKSSYGTTVTAPPAETMR